MGNRGKTEKGLCKCERRVSWRMCVCGTNGIIAAVVLLPTAINYGRTDECVWLRFVPLFSQTLDSRCAVYAQMSGLSYRCYGW